MVEFDISLLHANTFVDLKVSPERQEPQLISMIITLRKLSVPCQNTLFFLQLFCDNFFIVFFTPNYFTVREILRKGHWLFATVMHQWQHYKVNHQKLSNKCHSVNCVLFIENGTTDDCRLEQQFISWVYFMKHLHWSKDDNSGIIRFSCFIL